MVATAFVAVNYCPGKSFDLEKFWRNAWEPCMAFIDSSDIIGLAQPKMF